MMMLAAPATATVTATAMPQPKPAARAARPLRLEELQDSIAAYAVGENPAVEPRVSRAEGLTAAKRYLAGCILACTGQIRGQVAARAVHEARSKAELIAQLDGVCDTLATGLRGLAIGRVMDRTLVLLGEAG